MEETIINLAMQGTYAVLAFFFGYLWNKSRGLAEKQKSIDKGIRVLLKVQLKKIHQDSTGRGYVTYEEQSLAEEIYLAYHGLGGNGQGTALVKAIREMRVSDDSTEHS